VVGHGGGAKMRSKLTLTQEHLLSTLDISHWSFYIVCMWSCNIYCINFVCNGACDFLFLHTFFRNNLIWDRCIKYNTSFKNL